MHRRHLLKTLLAAAFGAPLIAAAAPATIPAPVIDVYKSANCGCCGAWVEHLQKSGFTVRAHNVANAPAYRAKFGIPEQLGSCHTGMVDGYALEGHVPARDIKRLLAQRPKAVGLAVPGMPQGSPGMEAAQSDPYDVVLVQRDGRHSVYQHYNGSTKYQQSQEKP
jgi:hypothetical protein